MEEGREKPLVEERSKRVVTRGGGADRLLVEWGGANRLSLEGRSKQAVGRGGGANRLIVEGEGQTDS